MMKIFVDTGAWIALADKNDQYHNNAKKLYDSIQKRKIPLIITDYIFDETVTWLHYKTEHKVACEWGNKILNSRMVDIIKVSDEHINLAWELFQKYHDQKFSFTDCISFTVMNLSGTSTVFAYDSHFSTMGFYVIGEVDSQETKPLHPPSFLKDVHSEKNVSGSFEKIINTANKKVSKRLKKKAYSICCSIN